MWDHIRDHMTYGDWLVFIGFAGFFLAIGISSGLTLLAANVLLLTGSWLNWYDTYTTDLNDLDNAYGVTDGTVYNPSGSGGGGIDCGYGGINPGAPQFCP